MAARRSSIETVDRELAALAATAEDPLSPASREALTIGLRSAHPRVVARAAEIVRDGEVDAIGRELRDAFERLVPLGVDGDPGCLAKLKVLEALDAGSWADEEPFLAATRVVQREPAFGPPYFVDTASGVRARGVLALARQAWSDLPLVAAELLDDATAPVRIAAADALAAHGSRDAAGALIFLRAIGLHRTERAVALLLARIAEGTKADAIAAIGALAPRRFDPGVVARARESAKGRDDLLRLIIEILEPTS